MGIVWEAYHKGVPLLGVPENPIENIQLISQQHKGSYIYIYKVIP